MEVGQKQSGKMEKSLDQYCFVISFVVVERSQLGTMTKQNTLWPYHLKRTENLYYLFSLAILLCDQCLQLPSFMKSTGTFNT